MSSINNIVIRNAQYREIENISKLVQSMYIKYASMSDSKEGVETFFTYSSKEEMQNRYTKDDSLLVIAEVNNALAGMIEMRDKSHISLCFVDDRYFRNKIATKLFSYVKIILGEIEYSVNSTPSAVPFYKSLGFETIDDGIKEKNGICFVPMIY